MIRFLWNCACSLFTAIILALVIIIGGINWFVNQIPTTTEATKKTDAIVVLTGGTFRVIEAIRLLNDGAANELLITGIGKGADLETLLMLSGPLPDGVDKVLSHISLGYEAENTTGNAEEAAQWMQKHNHRSLRLVTADYHMPRSLYVFHKRMPGVEIIPHPIAPENVFTQNWWKYPGTAWLLAQEGAKYLALMLF